MPLPNNDLSFAPKTVLSAADLNKLVANDRSLASGEGLDEGAIKQKHLQDASVDGKKIDPSSFDVLTPKLVNTSNLRTGGNTVATIDLKVGRKYLILGRFEFRNDPSRERQVFAEISGSGFERGRSYKIIPGSAYFDELTVFDAATVSDNGRVNVVVGCDSGEPANIVDFPRSRVIVVQIA